MDEFLQNEAVQYAITALFTIIGLCLTLLIQKASNYLKTKTTNEIALNVIESINDGALTVVKALQQTLVDSIKEASADGKLTDDEIDEIREAALTKLKSTLSTQVLATLETTVTDVDGYLRDKIEAALVDAKASSPIILEAASLSTEED